MKKYLLLVASIIAFQFGAQSQDHPHNPENHQVTAPAEPAKPGEGDHKVEEHKDGEHKPAEGHSPESHDHAAAGEHKSEGYDMIAPVMHHIGDANEYHIMGEWSIPLPCILYSNDKGLKVCMSSCFEHGEKAVDGYVLNHGRVMRIKGDFPEGEVALTPVSEHEGVKHFVDHRVNADKSEVLFVKANGKEYELEGASQLLNMTSWYDFSITRNVLTMLFTFLLMFFVFRSIANGYKTRAGKAPKGAQSLFEPVFEFLRNEVIVPNIGPKYERYQTFVYSLFFFILFNNLLGLIPIPLPPFASNVTGNISVTIGLAIFTFIVVNLSGNRHYWQHIFWMPGVPTPIRFIMAPIEIASIFIKPFTLFIRLFANITAGHIVILCLVSLIFFFGNNGENVPGSLTGTALAVPFVFLMNLLELMVAFLQAFIFALLTSLYIGSAIEEHHHEHDHEDAHAHH